MHSGPPSISLSLIITFFRVYFLEFRGFIFYYIGFISIKLLKKSLLDSVLEDILYDLNPKCIPVTDF